MAAGVKVRHVLAGVGPRVLCDYFAEFGDFVAYNAEHVLKAVQGKAGVRLFTTSNVEYVYKRDEEGFFALAMLDEGSSKSLAHQFIEAVHAELRQSVTALDALRRDPQPLPGLRARLEQLTSSYNASAVDKLGLAREEVQRSEEMLVESLTKLIDRSAHIDDMRRQVELLNENGLVLMRNAVRVRKSRERRRLRFLLLGFGALTALLYLLSAAVCGPALRRCF